MRSYRGTTSDFAARPIGLTLFGAVAVLCSCAPSSDTDAPAATALPP